MPSERTVRCRQWGPVPGDGAMSRWNGFRRNTMLGFHSRKSIVFDCGAPGAPQSRRPGCNAASAAAPKTRREELSRIASVNLKKASSGCRSAVSSRVLAFCVMVVCLVATLGVTACKSDQSFDPGTDRKRSKETNRKRADESDRYIDG